MANNLLGLYCLSYNQLTQNAPIVINEENIAMVVPSGTGSLVIYEETDGTSSEIICQDTIGQITQATALLLSTNPSTINGVSVTGTVLVNPGNINVITSVTGDTDSGGSNVTIEVSGTPGTVLGELTQSQDSFNPSWSYASISSIPTELNQTNLVIYFDAGDAQNIELDSSGNVEKWIGENGYYFYQGTPSLRPGYSGGALVFDGTTYMDLYNSEDSQAISLTLDRKSYSMFFVLNIDAQGSSYNNTLLSAANRGVHFKSGASVGDFILSQNASWPSVGSSADIDFDSSSNGQTGDFPGADGELFTTINNLTGNKILLEMNCMSRFFPNISVSSLKYFECGFLRVNGTASQIPATQLYDENTLGDGGDATSLDDLTMNAGFAFAPPSGGSSNGVGDDMIVSRVGAKQDGSTGYKGKIHEIAIYNGAMFGDQDNFSMNNGFDEGNMPTGATAGQIESYRGYSQHSYYNTVATYFTSKHSLTAV